MREPTYPEVPGWRAGPNSETSRAAAMGAKVKAKPLKDAVLDMVSIAPATPEELVSRFAARGETVLLNTIRARCTDLHVSGLLRPSGTFGLGESRKARVIRWRLSTAEELALFNARKAMAAENGGAS